MTSSKLRSGESPITSRADRTIRVSLQLGYRGTEQPHEAFANLRDEPEALKAFTKRFVPKEEPVRGSAWSIALRQPKVLNALRHGLRGAWNSEQDSLLWVRKALKGELFNFTIDHKQTVIEPRSLWGTILFLFLQDYAAGKTAICANPDCHSPYFIKKRKTQKYCTSGPCTEQAQREQKRLWWERNYGKGTK